MTPATVTVVCLVAADAVLVLGVALAHLHSIRALAQRDTTARQRYWRTQYAQNPPPLP